MSWSRFWNWWGWLTKPVPVYPNPPYNDDNNMRGLGWAGGQDKVRPFDERASHAPAHSVYGKDNDDYPPDDFPREVGP